MSLPLLYTGSGIESGPKVRSERNAEVDRNDSEGIRVSTNTTGDIRVCVLPRPTEDGG